MASMKHLLISVVGIAVLTAGCSSSGTSDAGSQSEVTASDPVQNAATGIRLVSATEGAAIQADPPSDLVILDVRTPEEFAEAHLEGATMIDFYKDDFADQLAELDPSVPYLLYCRSGNRSGQTTAIMEDLGFADVADIDGGILSWAEAGHATVNR